ncbi:hypothetical protein LIER_11429 [Lithospermum erythrorhizon]|uniref:Vinorine synthase-like n=1 Tax=Lithospermum erythrorhizon TaxID=34254 RepID=A0AAV3PN25_LITER
MVWNMEIISREIIKPSSKTPKNLKNHTLSFLDQLAPSVHIPLIFFYKFETSNNAYNSTQVSQLLKQSLSNTLTRFYPLAGRINGISSIDCNDEGVEYIEARVHAHVDQLIGHPTMEDLEKLIPKQPQSNTEHNAPLLSIQVNFFDCGGIAIGVCIAHRVADGSSFVTFMNAWSAICREDEDKAHQLPMFDSGKSYFPPKDMSGFSSLVSNVGISKEQIKTERLVFTKATLETLEGDIKDSGDGSNLKNPTRVEALSAFIWRNFIKSAKNSKKMFAAVHAVNLRSRMKPPLPENAFGNLWRHTHALTTLESEKDDQNFVHLPTKLREAISSINNEYIKKIQEGDAYFNLLKEHINLYFSKDIEFCNFSSWCNFPVYEVDFGWGKPERVSTMTFPYKNLVIFMSSRSGQEIEAWVNMNEDDISNLQKEIELLSHAAPKF